MTSAAGMFLFLLRLRLVGWGPKSPGFFLVRVLDGKRSAGGAERVQEKHRVVVVRKTCRPGH